MKKLLGILVLGLILFVVQPANVLKADLASDILKKTQELAEKQKLKGKSLSEFITNNVITVDYEGEERSYKFNTDITYEVYVGGKIAEEGTWAIKGLTKSNIKLTGHQDLYIQIYKDKERISTLTNLKKKNDSQTNRKILKIYSSSDFEKQLAQIELEKQKALEQKKKEEEEKRLAEEKKRQEEEEKRIAEEEKKRQEEEEKRIAEEEKKRQEEEEKRIAEEEKKKAEIQKIASSKLKKLDNYKKSNEQLLKKAEEISKKLYEFKDSKEINSEEGINLIDEYDLALENQYSQAIAEAAEVPYVETPIVATIHLPLANYVAKSERKIKKYQAALEKDEKKEKAEIEKQKHLAEKAEKKRIAEEKRKADDEFDKMIKEANEAVDDFWKAVKEKEKKEKKAEKKRIAEEKRKKKGEKSTLWNKLTGNDPVIERIINGRLTSCPNKTINQMVDGFMTSPKWSSGIAKDNIKFVNVSGKITYMEKPIKADIQFILKGEESFKFNALEFNEIPQNKLMAGALFTKMCDS